MSDPWAVLGLAPGSSIEDARAARRRMAKQWHPDLHAGRSQAEGAALSARMSQVNQALAAIENGEEKAPCAPEWRDAKESDGDGFSIDCLPVDAFEALFLAAYGLGDIVVADEPYLMELYLLEPAPCFCRLTLAPEAGGTIVTVDIGRAADTDNAPERTAVIDVLITELNALERG